MEKPLFGRVAIVVAFLLALAAAAVLAQALVQPGDTETTRQTRPAIALSPVAHVTHERARRGMSRRQKELIGRASKAFKQGDKRRARKIRNRVERRNWHKIPRRKRQWWDLFRVVPTRTSRTTAPSARAGARCAIAIKEISVTATIGWVIHTDIEMWSVRGEQKWCWRRGKVVRHGRLRIDSNLRGFGEFWGWSDRGVIGRDGYFADRRRTHVSSATNQFHQCTPTPVGCAFPRDSNLTLTITARGNGTFE